MSKALSIRYLIFVLVLLVLVFAHSCNRPAPPIHVHIERLVRA